MDIAGKSLIGFHDSTGSEGVFQAWNPSTGKKIDPPFATARLDELDQAANLAAIAFPVYSRLPGRQRAAFLKRIAAGIESKTDALVERAHQETGLPIPRLKSEVARTCGQLRMFASVLEEGSWVNARIDRADPGRKPQPKPDIRSMLHPLGPTAVFGASNFPLAFSVAGGDTASALAAGNPVIVKGHPAHPGTSELVGRAIRDSVREENLPEGVFSLLFDAGISIGAKLVQHPVVKAVGFTGSLAAGRALMNLAAARPEPIPFYGEMGSTNPFFILPRAMAQRGREIASQLHGSVTVGSGQFCTKPGMVFVPAAEAATFFPEFGQKVAHSAKFTVLTAGIRDAYGREVQSRRTRTDLKVFAEGESTSLDSGFSAAAVVFETDTDRFLASSELSAELFGPSTLLIRFSSKQQILEAARRLHGHLTATIHGTDEDLREFAELVDILKDKTGRLIFNGYPTGLEVCHAVIHSGPYPATTDSRSTSVGSQAIFRFARPVCYQDFPDSALPEELQNANPVGIWRMVDGELTRRPL
jgi:2,5-dioxopentanoate dehydrogenase